MDTTSSPAARNRLAAFEDGDMIGTLGGFDGGGYGLALVRDDTAIDQLDGRMCGRVRAGA